MCPGYSWSRDDTISGQPLPAGTVVHFKADSVFDWCFLKRNTEIQGYLCRGQGHGFMTGFHPNGQLRTAWLVNHEMIQGIPCARYRFMNALFGGGDATRFHDNGQLAFATLYEDCIIDGIEMDGRRVSVDQSEIVPVSVLAYSAVASSAPGYSTASRAQLALDNFGPEPSVPAGRRSLDQTVFQDLRMR